MSDDFKGYYAKLGLKPNATDADIKAVYRRLAKEHHPDSGNATDGGARFKGLSEAYAVLSDPEARARYDGQSATAEATSRARSGSQIKPISCEACRRVTAQPRFVVYRHVVSFVFGTVRTPIQGIFCAECAGYKSLRATAISAVAGWWGVPWGPLYTVSEGVRNAFGGSFNRVDNDRLLWQNALAFALDEQERLSLALADKVRGAHDRDIAADAAKLIDYFRSQGIELGSASLKDPWATSLGRVASHLLLVAALPAVLAIVIYGTSQQSTAITPSPYLAPSSVPPLSDAETGASVAAPTAPLTSAPPAQVCKQTPVNGKVFSGRKRLLAKGHMLESLTARAATQS